MKNFIIIILWICLCLPAEAKRLHPEKYYQNIWCSDKGGQQEVVMPNGSRADCITKDYAIEFDFADKHHEAIGQALDYGLQTGKQAGIVLILENYEIDRKFLERLMPIAEKFNIKIWTMP